MKLEMIEAREVLGKEFKIYGDFEEPYFLARDVAEWIEHSNVTEMLRSVDEDEKVKIFTNLNNIEVGSNTWFLTEDGLYEVLMQSRKPIAKQFKKQVKLILKEIRQKGYYISEPIREGVAVSSLDVEEITKIISTTITNIVPTLIRELRNNENIVDELIEVEEKSVIRRRSGCAVSKIEKLPPRIYSKVIEMFDSNEFTLKNIADYCSMNGYPVSTSSVHRFSLRYENNKF